ncbi:MAG: acylneuraminate cytidylyltransferase family protein [Microthrixaceae bacterium]
MTTNDDRDPGVWAVVPARGGSKGIPRKNLVEVGGRPLLSWVLDAARNATSLSGCIVTTDDDEIAALASSLDATVHRRPDVLGGDHVSTEATVVDVLEQRPDIDVVVLLQATSPFTTAAEIDQAVALWYRKAQGSVVSATRVQRFRWSDDGVPQNYDPATRPRRQDWNGELVENGAVYVSGRDAYLSGGHRCPAPVTMLELPWWSLHEVDEPGDLPVIDALLRHRGND